MVVTRSVARRGRRARGALTELPDPILLAIVGALGHGDRTRLAITCKTLLHAQWGERDMESVTLGEDCDTFVRAFRRCLELHPNRFTRSIKLLGLRPTTTSYTPFSFDIPYRQLGSLTSLHIADAAMHLPSLLCIARQLRSLTLLDIFPLDTGTAPGAQSDILAAGWDSLERLRLEWVCVDAAFGAVHLPSLEQLRLLHVRVGDAHGTASESSCADAFAAGCPRCTTLEYSQPLPVSPTAGLLCKDFLRVQELTLDVKPSQMHSMGGCEWPALPTTVSDLTFQADLEEWEERMYLDLHAMLAIAAAWVSVGVPLQQLCFLGCERCEPDLAPDHGQQQQSAAGRYAAVCASLRGVTGVKVLRSGGSLPLHDVNAMVAALPDLKELFMDLDVDNTEDVSIVCSGLESLELFFTFQYSNIDCHAMLGLNLGDASALRTCEINVDEGMFGGEIVEVHIAGHDACWGIVPSVVEIVCDGGYTSSLIISLGQGQTRQGTHGAAHVLFMYGYEDWEDVAPEGATWRALPVQYY